MSYRLARYISRGLAVGAPYNTLRLDLDGDLREKAERVFVPFITPRRRMALWEMLRVLHEAGVDPAVKAVLLRVGSPRLGAGRAEALWEALRGLRLKGKKVFAFSAAPSNLDYMVASAADHITVPPWAVVNTVGLALEVGFFGEMLTRLGVTPQFESAGRYKGAAEIFSRTSMSEPVRHMMESLYDGLYERFVSCIAEGRGLDREAVLSAVDAAPLTAHEAVDCGLADAVGYERDVLSRLGEVLETRARIVDARNYLRILNVRDRLRRLWSRLTGSPPVIALVVEEGVITSGSSRTGGGLAVMGARTVVKTLEAVLRDHSVRALVVRISSPGGSATASDIIYNKLTEVAARIPVVVSMGDVAASGAYMVALAADRIVGQSSTLTGSIGIIAGKFSLRRLLDKVGVNHEIITRGRHAAIHSLVREYDPSEKEKMERLAADLYDRFVSLVAERRRLDRERADRAAQGRVLLGAEAVEAGLVDEVGGLFDAVDAAKALAGVAEDEPIVLGLKRAAGTWRIPPPPYGGLVSAPYTGGWVEEALSELASEPFLALLPFRLRLC